MHSLFENIEELLGVFQAYEEDKEHDFCKLIATKIQAESDFPVECKQYKDCFKLFQKHSALFKGSATTSSAYAGLSPGDAIDARRSKEEGHLNNAQIKRRMTEKKNRRIY